MEYNNNTTSFWPQAIILSIAGFMTFIGYMVYTASKQDINLVRKDYYQEELKHETHINAIKRTAEMDIKMNYAATEKMLNISLPENIKSSEVIGIIHFYRPSDAGLDFKTSLSIDEKNTQTLSLQELKKGKWNVKFEFTFKGEEYFKEMTVFVK